MNNFTTKLKYIIYGSFLTSFSACVLLTTPPATKLPDNKDQLTPKVEQAVENYITNELQGEYLPYSFGELKIIKPPIFQQLDSLYLVRINLKRQKAVLKNQYDSLLLDVNSKIDTTKQEINHQKAYHHYEIEHIYLLTNNKQQKLYDNVFVVLPNYKVSDIHSKMATQITPEEKHLFEDYLARTPLFESFNYARDERLNNLTYDKFEKALENDTIHKDQLLHTILYSMEYIKEHNEFDQQEIMNHYAKKWLTENGFNPNEYLFGNYKYVTKDKKPIGYVISATNKNENLIDKNFDFFFDLNMVLESVAKK